MAIGTLRTVSGEEWAHGQATYTTAMTMVVVEVEVGLVHPAWLSLVHVEDERASRTLELFRCVDLLGEARGSMLCASLRRCP